LTEAGIELSKKFLDEGIIVSAPVFDRIISSNVNASELIESLKNRGEWLLTDELLSEFITREDEIKKVASDIAEEEQQEAKVDFTQSKSKTVYAKEIDSELRILDEFDVTGKSTCSGTLNDFVEYFQQRYKNTSRMLRERMDYRQPIAINRLKSDGRSDTARIICTVYEKRESSRGYRFLDVEDLSGEITILLPKDNIELKKAYENILRDETIGVSGRLSNDIFIADEIVTPDLPLSHKPKRSEVDVCAALLSDIHVGSYLFLEREFDSFLNWLEGNGNRRDISEKIKYIVIAGDLVDGVGIYPGQEKELTIPDVKKQYDFLAALISRIPDYIEVVLSVGNHDAMRNAEPQPRLSKDIAPSLYELSNVHLVSNPAMISMHGVDALIYHGTSLDTIIGSLSGCTYTSPENAMIEYLKRRSLVPTYGSDGIAPENKDYLAITRIPDILHCGHVHTNGYAVYRGVSVINSGTFQGRTKYQEQLGHEPTPARVPIINLKSGEVNVMHFGGEGGS